MTFSKKVNCPLKKQSGDYEYLFYQFSFSLMKIAGRLRYRNGYLRSDYCLTGAGTPSRAGILPIK